MQIRLAHLRIQGIDVAVFAARPTVDTNASCREVLTDLMQAARAEGLRVEKAALAYSCGRGIRYVGTPDLVRYLEEHGVSRWTHTLTV